jgi:hypothetical protein
LHSPYLLVYRFSLACCGAVCFFALVEILVEDIMVILFLGCGRVVSFWHCINFLWNFSSVSATSSYADDVAHT